MGLQRACSGKDLFVHRPVLLTLAVTPEGLKKAMKKLNALEKKVEVATKELQKAIKLSRTIG